MEIRERQQGDVTVLEPIGRLEGDNLSLLEDRFRGLLEEARERFVVDLAHVERVNSFGLRLLLTVARKLGRSDGDLVLCSMNDEVEAVFEAVGLARVFSIASSQEEAIGFLRQGRGKAREISRLAAKLLEVGAGATRGTSRTADSTRKRRLTTLAAGLLLPPEERPDTGEGPSGTVKMPLRAEPAPEPETGAPPAPGLLSRLWRHLRKR